MSDPQNILFKAIADPTRRKIIHLLSISDLSVKELTASFPFSQPAISQHLRELRSAQLVAAERVGRQHRYRLTGEPLREVYDWTRSYKRFFDPAGHAWAFTPSTGQPATTPQLAPKAQKGGKKHGN
jgi:DNA-binding transcriptional ArsR family regulator